MTGDRSADGSHADIAPDAVAGPDAIVGPMAVPGPHAAAGSHIAAGLDTGGGLDAVVGLDDVVHQRVRLGILVMLAEIPECAFATVRDELRLTDGNLNRHVQVLAEAGLISVSKGYAGNRPRTWLKLTRAGRRALRAELHALEQLTTRIRRANLSDDHSGD